MARPDRLAKSLVASALELHRRRPWREVLADAPFLLCLPGEEHPLIGFLIGQDREDYGLALLRGEGAFADVVRWLTGEDDDGDAIDERSMLSVTFEPLGAIDAALRKPLEAAGFRGRRERVAPFLYVKPPHRRLRAPNRAEMRLLDAALAGVITAYDAGELTPRPLDPHRRRILELVVEGEGRTRSARARIVPWPVAVEIPEAAPLTLPWSLAALPRLDERWLAALPVLPAAIEGDDRTIRALVVLEEESRRALGMKIVPGGEMEEAAAALAEICEGDADESPPGLPREIAFASTSLHDALSPPLAALGVHTSMLENGHPLLDGFLEVMFEEKERGNEELARRIADPESLEDWLLATGKLVRRLDAEIQDRDLATPRALAAYFGDVDVAEEVLDELAELDAFTAFAEWLLADYRPSRRARPYLERVLGEEGLSRAERTLIEAWLAAELSIYRVDATEPGTVLEVEDILAGRRHTIHDRALSGGELEGFFVPLRLVHVAEWTFCQVAGPPLGTMEIDAALAHLESEGAELTPDGLRRSAHLLGRLWGFVLDQQALPPALRNTDGDPFELQTATFQISDPVALGRGLEERPDVEYDESDGAWVWLRAGPPASGAGENTLLARLELLGDQLFVELNSARRLERIRAWLEVLPGIRFLRALPPTLDPTDHPLDDRLPAPPSAPFPPDLLAEQEKRFRAQCLAWLDEPVPALGHLTPRAAALTPEGRPRVARLIRTMPPMHHPGGTVPAPRDALFQELGLAPDA